MNKHLTFVEACLAGSEDPDNIDDFVDRWHRGGTGVELWEFLGMSRDEYGRWVTEPQQLNLILMARGPGPGPKSEHGLPGRRDATPDYRPPSKVKARR